MHCLLLALVLLLASARQLGARNLPWNGSRIVQSPTTNPKPSIIPPGDFSPSTIVPPAGVDVRDIPIMDSPLPVVDLDTTAVPLNTTPKMDPPFLETRDIPAPPTEFESTIVADSDVAVPDSAVASLPSLDIPSINELLPVVTMAGTEMEEVLLLETDAFTLSTSSTPSELTEPEGYLDTTCSATNGIFLWDRDTNDDDLLASLTPGSSGETRSLVSLGSSTTLVEKSVVDGDESDSPLSTAADPSTLVDLPTITERGAEEEEGLEGDAAESEDGALDDWGETEAPIFSSIDDIPTVEETWTPTTSEETNDIPIVSDAAGDTQYEDRDESVNKGSEPSPAASLESIGVVESARSTSDLTPESTTEAGKAEDDPNMVFSTQLEEPTPAPEPSTKTVTMSREMSRDGDASQEPVEVTVTDDFYPTLTAFGTGTTEPPKIKLAEVEAEDADAEDADAEEGRATYVTSSKVVSTDDKGNAATLYEPSTIYVTREDWDTATKTSSTPSSSSNPGPTTVVNTILASLSKDPDVTIIQTLPTSTNGDSTVVQEVIILTSGSYVTTQVSTIAEPNSTSDPNVAQLADDSRGTSLFARHSAKSSIRVPTNPLLYIGLGASLGFIFLFGEEIVLLIEVVLIGVCIIASTVCAATYSRELSAWSVKTVKLVQKLAHS